MENVLSNFFPPDCKMLTMKVLFPYMSLKSDLDIFFSWVHINLGRFWKRSIKNTPKSHMNLIILAFDG